MSNAKFVPFFKDSIYGLKNKCFSFKERNDIFVVRDNGKCYTQTAFEDHVMDSINYMFRELANKLEKDIFE